MSIDWRIVGAMFDNEPNKIAAYLIQAHGLEVAMEVVRKGIDKAHDEIELYRLSVWREVKQILVMQADQASTHEVDPPES